MSTARNLFAYVIVGDSQVARVNHSLEFLKRFVRCDVVVVAGRCTAPIHHDQIVRPRVEASFDDHQASILLKTNLHRVLGVFDSPRFTGCYLDSDVIAVNAEAGSIFGQKSGPVTFAPDHSRLARFSRFAVRCPCCAGECDHLRQGIREKFGIEITEPDWQHWNGGVYLFDAESTEFLDTWHDLTRRIFADPFWKTRDQGTLVATVWKLGLEEQPTLDRKFNYIVDPMLGASDKARVGMQPCSFRIDTTYSLNGEPGLSRPYFLHMINWSVGASGWKNWDDAASLLARMKSRTAASDDFGAGCLPQVNTCESARQEEDS
jgi:hypothetical protein